MEQELFKKVIVYSGGELGKTYPLTKIIDENGNKYTVFHEKKDKTITKAYEQLGALSLGTKVGIAYKEEDKTFVPKDGDNKGKEVSYKSRIVAYFADVDQGTEIKPEYDFSNKPTGTPDNNPVQANPEPPKQSEPLPTEPEGVIENLPF